MISRIHRAIRCVLEWANDFDGDIAALRIIDREPDLFGRDILNRSNGRLTTGSLYPTLARLEDRGLIVSTPEATVGDGPKRRTYRITYTGRMVLSNEVTP